MLLAASHQYLVAGVIPKRLRLGRRLRSRPNPGCTWKGPRQLSVRLNMRIRSYLSSPPFRRIEAEQFDIAKRLLLCEVGKPNLQEAVLREIWTEEEIRR